MDTIADTKRPVKSQPLTSDLRRPVAIVTWRSAKTSYNGAWRDANAAIVAIEYTTNASVSRLNLDGLTLADVQAWMANEGLQIIGQPLMKYVQVHGQPVRHYRITLSQNKIN